ncbi:hypothetical protein GCM10007857_75890 [Bradyrhizobium iriomotense]|uniref:Uncharacterized protein n=1 Tax=Bradyrhizobium iriomotense TaxID=441950 RepID=A0ABQ6BAR7_9BRAD|nr:hypothetical protein GCM10007857_75890 [Bradyrhizobium iriomotense]
MTKGSAKPFVGHAEESIGVRRELWRLRMQVLTIEYLTNRLALIGRQGRNEDQRLDPFVDTCSYDGASIGMRDKHHWTIGAFQRALKCSDII